ncbi:hypothetical protein [Paenibacillus sp.]|uniref:hypothetical protein n=1 Tax=Paenibacillus sp. TaxID=58172 RepID=UPI002810E2B5|nr:hypothetical protein [Paenibacillus sp.]
MNVGSARAAAAAWVREYAGKEAGFMGAYMSGSTIGLPDETPMSPTSDLDVVIVTAADEAPPKLGKLVYRGALLEITYLPWNLYVSAEEVLASYHLAGSFRTDTILADPTGQLSALQAEVSRRFAERTWASRRCENARKRVEDGLRAIDPTAPRHDQVMSWVFPTGVTAHVLLAAALRNPTVRLRYLAAREVLETYGFLDIYPELLRLLGCERLSAQRVEHHLDELARTFDAAAARAKSTFFFSSDIAAAARPIAIDGSRDLIRAGNHREAVFWILVTFCRCHKIFAVDAPEVHLALTPAFDSLASDLGIDSTDALLRRAEEGLRFLTRLSECSEAILDANPEIRR